MTTASEPRTAAERILERINAQGATGDLIISRGESLSLKARDAALEEHKVTSSQVFGVRVIKDDRAGIAYSEAADDAALDSMVDQALINASFARTDEHERISTNAATLSTDDSLLCPSDDVDIEHKIDTALTLESGLVSRPKVKNVPYNGVTDAVGEQFVFSTAGLDARGKSRMCFARTYALLEDGEKNVMEGYGAATRRFDELDVDAVVDEAYARCLALLDGEAIPSAHYDVLFDIETQDAVFGVFSMMFSGKSAKDGVNPMRDKVGETIAASELSVIDAPERIEGFHYSLFDDEGTPAKRITLIGNGRLETLIHNSATASFYGCETTGHATRSARSPLGVGIHQAEIAAGSASEADLFAGEYLELVDLTGLHSGANPISGDFSFGASGFLCRDGERLQAVRNITVAGNFYEMIKRITAIGDQQFWTMDRSALMARIRFHDVAISG